MPCLAAAEVAAALKCAAKRSVTSAGLASGLERASLASFESLWRFETFFYGRSILWKDNDGVRARGAWF